MQIPFVNIIIIGYTLVTENENLYKKIKIVTDIIEVDFSTEMVDELYRLKPKFTWPNVIPAIVVKFNYHSVKTRFIVQVKTKKDMKVRDQPVNIYF